MRVVGGEEERRMGGWEDGGKVGGWRFVVCGLRFAVTLVGFVAAEGQSFKLAGQ